MEPHHLQLILCCCLCIIHTWASMANSRVSRLTQCYGKQLPGPFDKICSQLQQRVMISQGLRRNERRHSVANGPTPMFAHWCKPFRALALSLYPARQRDRSQGPPRQLWKLLRMLSSCLTLLNDHPVLTICTLGPILQAGGHGLAKRRKCRFITDSLPRRRAAGEASLQS